MPSLNKTIIIQVLPDEATKVVLMRQARDSARWMNTVFRTLYTDKRNHKWEVYGPGKDWGKSYGPIVKWQEVKKCWKVVGEALYPAFIGQTAPNRPYSDLDAASLQALSMRVAIVWGDFLSGDRSQHPNGHLPEFGPVSIYHAMSKDIAFSENGFTINVLHPYERRKILIPSVNSKDIDFIERINLVKSSIKDKSWSAIEIKLHEDNKWYAHIPISIEVPNTPVPDRITGIDMGVRNTFSVATVKSDTEIPKPKIHDGMKCVHQLERIQARVRGLRSAADCGNKRAKRKMRGLRGKRRRIQETMIRQSAMEIINTVKRNRSKAIIIEELGKMNKPGLSKRQNRLITNWGRGIARDFIEFKAAEHGLRFATVFPGGTSQICPKCGKKDKKARDLNTHLYTCKACGFRMNDDATASINIAHRGWRRLGLPSSRASRSSPRAGGYKGQDSRKVGETFNPHKQIAVRSPAVSNDALVITKGSNAPDDNAPMNPMIGSDGTNNVDSLTSQGRARSEPVMGLKEVLSVDPARCRNELQQS